MLIKFVHQVQQLLITLALVFQAGLDLIVKMKLLIILLKNGAKKLEVVLQHHVLSVSKNHQLLNALLVMIKLLQLLLKVVVAVQHVNLILFMVIKDGAKNQEHGHYLHVQIVIVLLKEIVHLVLNKTKFMDLCIVEVGQLYVQYEQN